MRAPEPFDPHNLIDSHEVLTILAARVPQLPTRQTVWNWMERGVKVAPDKRIYLQSVTKLGTHYTTRKWLEQFLKDWEVKTYDLKTDRRSHRR